MLTLSAWGLLALAGFKAVQASPTSRGGSSEPCTSFNIPISITTDNHIYDVVRVDNSIDAIHFAQDIDTWSNPSYVERIVENITISRTYDIHGKICIPPNGSKRNLLQIATHGGVFDSRYWDSEIEPEKYSYVKAALDAGYSILTYDRIGCGQSSRPNAYTDIQISGQVEVLRGVTEAVRSGEIWKYISNRSAYGNVTFDKIIHVGHSLGSITTYGLTSIHPNVSDAAVLTGFLLNKEIFSQRQTAKGLEYAPQNSPELFGNASSGYLVSGTVGSVETGFFSSRANETTGIGGFDPKLLDYAYSLRQPQGVAEDASAQVIYFEHPRAPQFTGPVQFLVGEFDFILCLGDCKNTYNTTMIGEIYPQASDIDIQLQPGTGHGLPFHHGAQTGFQTIFDWLEKNGF